MDLPSLRNQRRVWVIAALVAGAGLAVLVVGLPLLPREPDLYVHLVWTWEVMRCLANGQPPVWLPDLNAGFGSPGIRLYSPLGPVLSGVLGLMLGEAGRGLRAAALLAAAGVLGVFSREPKSGHKLWPGVVGLACPMVVFSLLGRAAWSEFLAVPLLWWTIERLVDGGLRPRRDGVVVAVLWLTHAPSAILAGGVGGASALIHRSRRHSLRLVLLAATAAGLTAWHWLPLVRETAEIGGGAKLTNGIFEPARNVLGSETAHALHHNLWLGWVAVLLLLAVLVTGCWRSHPGRTALAVGCIVLSTPLSIPLWRLETPFQLLQFPWRWLLPATLLLVPGILGARRLKALGLACLLAPTLMMSWIQPARIPAVDENQGWSEVGLALNESIGANPFLVDAEQNRPASFSDLSRNLQLFGPNRLVVFGGPGNLLAIHRWRPLRREIEVAGSAPFVVGLRILDYPYWSVSTDSSGRVEPGGLPGVVACRLPAGKHRLDVRWRGNPLSAIGLLLAGATGLTMYLVRRRERKATS